MNASLLSRKFSSLPCCADLETLIQAMVDHRSMRVENAQVQNNMVRASLVFTMCFYANLVTSLRGTLDRCGSQPLVVRRDTRLLHLFLALAEEELATDNLPLGQSERFSPHFVPMYEAALAAGVDVAPVDRFMAALEGGASVAEAALGQGFVGALVNYLKFSGRCAGSFEMAFATIALRELTLSANFRVILDSLPDEDRFAKYRTFLSGHVELDEGGHAGLMAEALADVPNPEMMLDTMIEFYRLRLAVYDACLGEGIF